MAKKKPAVAPIKRGRGRPTLEGGPAIVLTVSVPRGVAQDLATYAEAQDLSKSAVVVEALKGFLARKKR